MKRQTNIHVCFGGLTPAVSTPVRSSIVTQVVADAARGANPTPLAERWKG
jgi:hypothetical protein